MRKKPARRWKVVAGGSLFWVFPVALAVLGIGRLSPAERAGALAIGLGVPCYFALEVLGGKSGYSPEALAERLGLGRFGRILFAAVSPTCSGSSWSPGPPGRGCAPLHLASEEPVGGFRDEDID